MWEAFNPNTTLTMYNNPLEHEDGLKGILASDLCIEKSMPVSTGHVLTHNYSYALIGNLFS